MRTFFIAILITAFILLLAGCATTSPQLINIPKVQAPLEIMGDCGVLDKLKDGTFEEAIELLVSNSKIFYDCKNLNQAKKDFIIRETK
jgi:uncharacterized lipoprotein YajG